MQRLLSNPWSGATARISLGMLGVALVAGWIPAIASAYTGHPGATYLSWQPLRKAESPAQLMPATTIAYGEWADPSDLVSLALEHPLRARIEAIDDVQAALDGPQFAQFKAGIKLAEFRLGMNWQEAVATLSGQGAAFGFDAATQGVVVLTHASSEDELSDLVDDITDFVRGMVGDQQQDAFEDFAYRDISGYKVDQAIVAQLGEFLMLTNNESLAQKVADLHLDGGDCLHDNAIFQAASKSQSDRHAWAYVDLKTVRNAGLANDLVRDKSDNFATELLFGGVQETLRETDFVSVGLEVDQQQINLNLRTPFQPSWIREPRGFFFGESAQGEAPAPLVPNQLILSAVTYRDISNLWLAKEDLFEENVIAELSQADSNLSTLFSGIDFGEDVLGSAGPAMQLVVTRQSYEDQTAPIPAIKLPAFAVVFELQEPERVQRRFKIAFQSLVGFLNLGMAQQGQPQLEMATEEIKGASLVTTSYYIEDDTEGRINYNFSPSIGFAGRRFVISSTNVLARELSGMIQTDDFGAPSGKNTHIELMPDPLQQILDDNRAQLVAQNILEEGSSREEAEQQIGTLLSLLKSFGGFSADLSVADENLQFEATLKFAE